MRVRTIVVSGRGLMSGISLLMAAALVLVVFPGGTLAGVDMVYHAPTRVRTTEALTVYVGLSNISGVKDVMLLFCQLTPEYICHMPVDMLPYAPGKYRGTTKTMQEYGIYDNATGGYNITIWYNDSSRENVPTEPNMFTNLTVVHPTPESAYFQFEIWNASAQTNNTPPPDKDGSWLPGAGVTLLMVSLVLAASVATFIHFRRRGDGGR